MTKTIDGKFIFTHKGEDYVYFVDYVNLLQKVEKLKEKINTYEKAKDKIKELQAIEKEHQKINGELREENKALKEQLKELNRHLDASTVSEEEWLDYAINYNLEQLEKRCIDG